MVMYFYCRKENTRVDITPIYFAVTDSFTGIIADYMSKLW